MSKKTNLPAYRVKFCPVIGTDDTGSDKLGSAIEIGALWPRKDAKKGFIQKLSIVPANLNDGVLLIMPVETDGGAQ